MKKALQAGKKIAGMACILVFGCLLSVLSCSHAQAGAGDQDKAQGPGRILRVAYPELKGMSETDENGTRHGIVVDYLDRKSTRLNSSHIPLSRMPSSA